MRSLWTVAGLVLAAVVAGPAPAQVPSGTSAGTTAGGFNTTAGGSTVSQFSSGGTTTGSTTGNTGNIGGTQLSTMQKAPSLSLASMKASTAIAPSNNLGIWYASPYYLGSWTNATNVNSVPGGFGTALFPYTGGTGAAGGRGGAAGATGFGATTGRAGAAGAGGVNTMDPGGQIATLPRQIAYTAAVRFPAPATPPTRLLADLRGTIDRTPTSMLANPAGVQFQVEGRAVTLRGTVRDAEEARLVEGMVRLTPGVGLIRNELTYPQP